jgi:hypothetical protein
MDGKNVSQIELGDTLFIVTSESASTAKETLKKKLERLIMSHVADTKSYQNKGENQLAMCDNQSEYRTDTI